MWGVCVCRDGGEEPCFMVCSRKSRNSITHRPKIPLPYPNPDVHYRLTSRPWLIFIRKSSRYNDVKNLSRLNWEELESEGIIIYACFHSTD